MGGCHSDARIRGERGSDGGGSMKGALLLALGVFACCLLPLLLVAGGLVILSFLVQNETLVALVTVFVLALLFYAVYLRRKRNAGDTRADLIEVAES